MFAYKKKYECGMDEYTKTFTKSSYNTVLAARTAIFAGALMRGELVATRTPARHLHSCDRTAIVGEPLTIVQLRG